MTPTISRGGGGSLWYAGDAFAFVWSGGAALVATAMSERAVRRVWDAVRVEPVGLGDFLAALTQALGTDLLSLPPFAVALVHGGEARVAARGECELRVSRGLETVSVSGRGVSTWSERAIDDVTWVSIVHTGSETGSMAWPLEAGVVRAGRLDLGALDVEDQTRDDAESGAESGADDPAGGMPLVPGDAVPAEQSEPVDESQVGLEHATPDDEAADLAGGDLDGVGHDAVAETDGHDLAGSSHDRGEQALPAEAVQGQPAAAAANETQQAAPPEVAAEAGQEPPVWAWSGASIQVPTPEPSAAHALPATSEDPVWVEPVESAEAPVPEPAHVDVAQVAADAAEAGPVEVQLEVAEPGPNGPDEVNANTRFDFTDAYVVRKPPHAESSAPDSAADGADDVVGELIVGVPGRTGAPAWGPPREEGNIPSVGGPAGDGDHDGLTVVGFSLQLPAPEAEVANRPSAEETVLALVCGAGHPNRPHAVVCRVCGDSLAGRSATQVPRPTLGYVRCSTGERLPLGAPIIAGRTPRAARVHGTVLPRLLALPYPHVSSNHVEIRIDGWNVFATDLDSRNGTFLLRQGDPPVRISRRLLLCDADVLDLGRGVTLTFEELP